MDEDNPRSQWRHIIGSFSWACPACGHAQITEVDAHIGPFIHAKCCACECTFSQTKVLKEKENVQQTGS